MPNGHTLEERLLAVELGFKSLKKSIYEKIEELQENHVKHVEIELRQLKWYMFTTVIGVLILLVQRLI